MSFDYKEAKRAGFSDEEIRDELRPELLNAGFSEPEINAYFKEESGEKMLSLSGQEQSDVIKSIPRDLGFLDAIELGFKGSNTGMLTTLEAPPQLTPEEEESLNFPERIARSLSAIVSDIPFYVAGAKIAAPAGAVGGGAIGSVVPGIGTAAGAGVGAAVGGTSGAFALHSAVRSILVQAYKQGDVSSYGELLERLENVDPELVGGEAAKGAAIGALTSFAGLAAKVGAAALGAGTKTTAAAGFSGEVAGLTAASAGVEGKMPTADDFIENAALIGLLKATNKTSVKTVNKVTNDVLPKLHDAFVKFGAVPEQIVEMAKKNPIIFENILSKNLNIDGSQIIKEKREIKKAYNEVKKNPFGGTPEEVLASINPEELNRFLIQRGAAIKDVNGDIIIQGKQLLKEKGTERNFGLTKIIFKHGLKKRDMAKLPEFLREYDPAETNDRLVIYRIPKNKKEVYAIVFNKEAPSSTPRLIMPEKADTPEPITISASGEGASESIVSESKNKNKYLVSMYKEAFSDKPLSEPKSSAQEVNFVAFSGDNAIYSHGNSALLKMEDTKPVKLDAQSTVRISDIIKNLEEKINIPIRVGKFRKSGPGHLGIYKIKPEVIRLSAANDIQTATHEIGHHLEKTLFGKIGSDEITAWYKELKPIATKPRKRNKASFSAEGFAEFVSKYVAKPDEAKKLAPKFYDFFETKLDEIAPQIKNLLLDARASVDAWAKQPAEMQVLSHVSIGKRDLPFLKVKSKEAFNKLYTAFFDDLYPIKDIQSKLGIKEVTGSDPYGIARLQKDWLGKAEHFLQKAPFNYYTYKNEGRPLRNIINDAENINEFTAYLTAKRAIELNKRGITTGIPMAAAKITLKNLDGKYSKLSEELYKYQDAVLRYVRDAGLISDDVYSAIKEQNRFYIPFKRVINETGKLDIGNGGKGFNAKNPIKRIKGSARDIIDPIESIVASTYNAIFMAEKNKVAMAIADLARIDKAGLYIEKIPKPMKAITLKPTEEMLEQGFEDMTIFRPTEYFDKNNQIQVFKNGETELFQVDPSLAKIMNGLDPVSVSFIGKVMMQPKKWLTAGATLTPDFIAKNGFRDTIHAFITSENSFTPVKDNWKGLRSAAKKDDIYWEWRKAGGGMSAQVSSDRSSLQKRMKDLMETGYAKKVFNTIKPSELPLLGFKIMEGMRVASEVIESSTRIGEFQKAMKGKEASPENLRKAAFASRDITLDFARSGYITRAINSYLAFFNAGMQGTDKFIRTFKNHPAKAPILIAASIITPSVFFALASHDDEAVMQVPQAQRDIAWVFRVDDVVFRLPKPQQFGYIGTLVERGVHYALDKMDGKERSEAFHNAGKAFMEEFQLGVIPTFAMPIIEEYANKNLFMDRPIIPYDRENALPEYQFTPYTTELTKGLSKIIGEIVGQENTFSPAVAENYLNSWGGGTARYILNFADFVSRKSGILPDPVKPADTLADVPFVRAFVARSPSAGAESIQRFYEEYESMNKFLTSFKLQIKDLNSEEAQKLSGYAGYAAIMSYKNNLSELSQTIRLIEKDPVSSAGEKRQLIDHVYLGMISIAKEGLQAIYAIKDEINQKPESGGSND